MKVTLVGTNDKAGGAARAMYRLHQALLAIGIQSRILCLNKSNYSSPKGEISKFKNNFFSRKSYPFLQDLINENRTPLSNTLFSYTDSISNLVNHPFIQDADIVNLHWVSYFVSIKDIGKLLKLGKKIVWTLHDEWAYTGGCHYTSGCDGYLNDCKFCPQVNSNIAALPELIHSEKTLNFSSEISLVSPSRWLAEKASQSSFFKGTTFRVIPNSIESDWFTNNNRSEARAQFGYPEDCFLIGFGADSIGEKRKGFVYLLEALKILSKNREWNDAYKSKKIAVLFFGNYSHRDAELDNYAQHIGSFSDDQTLISIYKMLDLFLIPSLEDNLPNTLLESMASGTPVLGFPVGGLTEMITHNKNGFLTESISAEDLAKQILFLWQNNLLLMNVGAVASEFARSSFSMKKQANLYRDFFEMVLLKSNNRILDTNAKEQLKKRQRDLKLKFNLVYKKYIDSFTYRRRLLNLLLKNDFLAKTFFFLNKRFHLFFRLS
ncbi:glycosyltransferase [Leptospira sp. 201903074]|uniref:glycosyltransferase n=1 Tax=Leptospira abararensis TaxID=2810036 RepID=UPI0019646C6A|nr:glycosyltransferase [Leptospira abararensis]MBM9547008.1 glycosyltransferase [Leptospira abararensis]